MVRIAGKTYYDEHLALNGVYARRCIFDGCVLELRARPPYCDMQVCTFKFCQFVGDGWPPEFLAAVRMGYDHYP